MTLANQVQVGLDDSLNVEIGFVILLKAALSFSGDPLGAISLLAALSCVLVAIGYAAMPQHVLIPLLPLYTCYFLLDNAFNGVRLGLALGLTIIGAATYLRGLKVTATFLVVAAASIQFTVVVLPALFLVRELRHRKVLAVPLAVGATAVSIFYSTRVENKLQLYTEQADKGWSGAGILVLAAILTLLSLHLFGFDWFHAALAGTILICVVPNEFGYLTVRVAQLILIYFGFEIGLKYERMFFERGGSSRYGILSPDRLERSSGENIYAARIALLVLLIWGAAALRLRNVMAVLPGELSPYVPFVIR